MAAHDARGVAIPRPVDIPGLGRCWVRPLEYGDVQYYEQAPETPTVRARLFRQTLVGGGFAHCTAADVRRMWPLVPAALEVAIYGASDLLADPGPGPNTPATTSDGEAVGLPGPEPIEDPASSPFAQHHDTAPDTKDVTDADLVHVLHDSGYTQREMATLLLGEIETIMEGRKRAADRQEEATESSSDGGGGGHVATGNRGDRAAQLGWR